jgi:hypothetical protein
MTRLCFKLALLFVISLTVLAVVARAMGSTQIPNPVAVGFTTECDGQPQPCWYGIVPGVTTVEEATSYLLKIGYVNQYDEQRLLGKSDYCDIFHQYWLKNHTIIGILLQDCPHINLGLVINMLDAPEWVTPGGDGEVILTFRNSITVTTRPTQDWLSPTQSIWFISMAGKTSNRHRQ